MAYENKTETIEGETFNHFRNQTKKIYDDYLKTTDNKRTELYFHGSRNENFISILKTGLLIRPSGAIHTGSMFGDGIYFAPKARKSFAARHQCHLKKDKTKAGYWACRLNKFGHLFGGRSTNSYW